MSNPGVIGRFNGDETNERATTEKVCSIAVPFEGGAVGEVKISVFRSTDVEDRGGIVLRITLDDRASSFQPYSKNINGGVELHMAGDIEAQSLSTALKGAIATI